MKLSKHSLMSSMTRIRCLSGARSQPALFLTNYHHRNVCTCMLPVFQSLRPSRLSRTTYNSGNIAHARQLLFSTKADDRSTFPSVLPSGWLVPVEESWESFVNDELKRQLALRRTSSQANQEEQEKRLRWYHKLVFQAMGHRPAMIRACHDMYNHLQAAVSNCGFMGLVSYSQPRDGVLHQWFTLSMLHMWMIFVRLRDESDRGAEMTKELFDVFWAHMEKRMIEEQDIRNPFTLSKFEKQSFSAYQGSLLAYDTALAEGTDVAMAMAIHRNLFSGMEGGNCESRPHLLPHEIALAVNYVRRSLATLFEISSEDVRDGVIYFGPPLAIPPDISKEKPNRN